VETTVRNGTSFDSIGRSQARQSSLEQLLSTIGGTGGDHSRTEKQNAMAAAEATLNLLMQEFVEKVAVITGAASGIGRAVADAFALRGRKLVLADVEVSPLEEASGPDLGAWRPQWWRRSGAIPSSGPVVDAQARTPCIFAVGSSTTRAFILLLHVSVNLGGHTWKTSLRCSIVTESSACDS
jgi:hypothetical protein